MMKGKKTNKKNRAALWCGPAQWSRHFSKSQGRDSDINHNRENSHCQENPGSLQLSKEEKKGWLNVKPSGQV